MVLLHIAHSLVGMATSTSLLHLSLPVVSAAASATAASGPPPGSPTDPFDDLTNLAIFLQTFILGLGATIFVIGVAIAGIMRMVAFGSERRIATSNMALTAAVVGLIIMLIGAGLLTVLKSVFGVQ
jgi:hypothetical protein